jgi:hypothetical protein
MSKNLCGKSLNAGAILAREFEEWESGEKKTRGQGDKGTFLSNTPVFRMISHRDKHGDGGKRLLITSSSVCRVIFFFS